MARNRRTKRTQPTTRRDSAPPEPKSASARKDRREQARERSRSKDRERFLLLGILAITALAYVNALGGEFVYDDRLQILKNPTLNSLANIPRMFTQGVWQFLNSGDKNAVGPYYRPLFNIALIINHQLFGLEVFGWHLFSILVHIGVVYLVYRLARQWNLSTEAAMAAALLFGVHPVHSESVAWVAALPDPLAAVFILGSLLLYERYYHGQSRKPIVRGASVALALAAMLSKEVAVIFPLFLVAREFFDRPEGETVSHNLANTARRTAPFFAMIALYLGMRYYVLGFLRQDEPSSVGIPVMRVLITLPSILLSYARMLFAPFPLAVMYGNRYVESLSDIRFLGAAIGVAALVAGAIWLVRPSPVGRRALAFLIIFLVPVFNLKGFRAQESLLHDRYLYLPSIGFCILVAMSFEWISERFTEHRRQAFITATAITAAILLGLTFYQNFTWQNELAMTNNALKVTPRWPFLHNYIGAYYADQHKYPDAQQAYLDAIDINPTYYDAYSNLGDIYREEGKLADAEQAYLKALEYGAPYADTHYNLGVTYINENKLSDAEQPLVRSLELSPANTKARYNLGWTYDREGKDALAEQAYAETLKYDQTYPEARINLGILLAREGRYPEALEQLHTAQQYAPGHPVLRYALADLSMRMQHYDEAIAAFNELDAANLHQNLIHTSLGLCYESLGKKEEAKAQFQKAIDIAPQDAYTNTAREHLAKLLAGA
jgi:tetratricopeptide (TPR) repeat protein